MTEMLDRHLSVLFAGCGALGSQIAVAIVRSYWSVHLLDNDIVEEGNVTSGTTAYSYHQIGRPKVYALAEILYRRYGVDYGPKKCFTYEKRAESIDLFKGYDLVIDTFDNAASRVLTMSAPCVVHAAVAPNMTGIVVWDKSYSPPQTTAVNEVCTRDLGRIVIRFTAAVAACVIESWADTGVKQMRVVTKDLRLIE